MEVFISLFLGVIGGAIYTWPFIASKSYKRLVTSRVKEGRAVALLMKVISMVLTLPLTIFIIIAVRAFASKALAVTDLLVCLGTGAISFWVVWLRATRSPRW
jgi:hypothetical protein